MDSSIWSYDCTPGFMYAILFLFFLQIYQYIVLWIQSSISDTFLSSAFLDQIMMLYIMVCLFLDSLRFFFNIFGSYLFVSKISISFLISLTCCCSFLCFMTFVSRSSLNSFTSLYVFQFHQKILEAFNRGFIFFQYFWVLSSRNYDPLEASDYLYLPCFSNFCCNLWIFWFDC